METNAISQTKSRPPVERNGTSPHAPAHEASDILLTRFARHHDPHVRERLVECHEKLVIQIARRFVGRGETLEDLIQVGTIGLIKAIDRFDPTRHLQFSTYAVPTIAGEIKRYLRDKGWELKISRRLKELYVSAKGAQAELTSKLGRAPTMPEMAQKLGITEAELVEVMGAEAARFTVSDSSRIATEGEGPSMLTVGAVIGEDDASIVSVPTRIDLQRAIATLEPGQQSVIRNAYFQGLTQSEIGKLLDVSQMQVSRLHKRALSELRRKLRSEMP